MRRMPTSKQQAANAAEIVDALFTLMPLVVDHVDSRLADLDMTNTDLWALRSIEGPMPMKDLATCMDFDPSYVTVVADRLESRGLIERQPHPTDRRVKNLVLTAKGAEMKATALDRIWSGDNMFRALTESERRTLLDLVAKLTEGHRGPDST